MANVRIPPVLRSQTGGQKDVEIEGGTAGEVLIRLADAYPAIKSHLFQDGDLQRYVNIYVNDQDIQYLQKLDTPVGAKDSVIILPAMAGGA